MLSLLFHLDLPYKNRMGNAYVFLSKSPGGKQGEKARVVWMGINQKDQDETVLL